MSQKKLFHHNPEQPSVRRVWSVRFARLAIFPWIAPCALLIYMGVTDYKGEGWNMMASIGNFFFWLMSAVAFIVSFPVFLVSDGDIRKYCSYGLGGWCLAVLFGFSFGARYVMAPIGLGICIFFLVGLIAGLRYASDL